MSFDDLDDATRAYVDRLLAEAPPLNREQINLIRQTVGVPTFVDGEWQWIKCGPLPGPAPRPRVSLVKSRVALYRHWDEEGVLLYVGITDAPVSRTRQHAFSSHWATFSNRCEISWYANRDVAMHAERKAIQAERPLFNVIHADPERDARLVDYLVKHGRWDLIRPGV